MRKFLLFTLICLAYTQVISQNLNIANHRAIDKCSNIISINSKVFFMESSETHCCGYSLYLLGLNDQGDTILTTGLPGQQVEFFGKVIKTNDNAIFLNYWTVKSCDLGGHFDNIVKIDTNGTVLFNSQIQASLAPSFSPTIIDITEHADGSFYLASTTELYHYSSTGQFLSKINSGLTNVTAIKALTNGRLLLNGNLNNILNNVEMTTGANIVKQQISQNAVVKFIESGNSYYGRTWLNSIEKYDTLLTLGAVFNNYEVSDFIVANDSLFTVGWSGALKHACYALLDTALNILHQSISSYKGIYPTGIALTNKNKVNVNSTCRSKKIPEYTFIGYNRFDKNGGFNFASDIGVTGFSNLNVSPVPAGGFPSSPYISMDVIVKNFGSDTVKSFYLNYYAKYMWCYILFHERYTLQIAPGASISVATGTFMGQPIFSSTPGASVKSNICLFTTVPNNSNDVEIDNDAFCDTVSFIVTGINENEFLSQSINVSPNPSQVGFKVKSELELNHFELINSLGELMQENSIKTKEFVLETALLRPGIYFLKLVTQRGQVIKKLIKN